MANFAQLDENNIVLNVISVNNDIINNLQFPESEELGIQFCKDLVGLNTSWKQTSYNNNFRKRYASIGFLYNEELDSFIPPKPFDNWVLNKNLLNWVPPVPYPVDGNQYYWNQEQNTWEISLNIPEYELV